MPTDEEINQAWDALCAHEKKIDYVISHCAPTELQSVISQKKQDDSYQADRLTDFLQKVYSECSFRSWYCGHYHCAMKVGKLNVLYENCRTVA